MFKRIKWMYWQFFASSEQYARYIGVNLGQNCLIATRNWSSEPYLITIGNHVQVTSDVRFQTHGGGNVFRDRIPDFDVFGKIEVKDWAYIGAGAQIMPGVTIGSHAIVAAGAIVTRSVSDYTVVGGNPARVICKIEDYLQKYLPYNLKCKKMDARRKREYLLSLPDDRFVKK